MFGIIDQKVTTLLVISLLLINIGFKKEKSNYAVYEFRRIA
jgi:hypothetical protein